MTPPIVCGPRGKYCGIFGFARLPMAARRLDILRGNKDGYVLLFVRSIYGYFSPRTFSWGQIQALAMRLLRRAKFWPVSQFPYFTNFPAISKFFYRFTTVTIFTSIHILTNFTNLSILPILPFAKFYQFARYWQLMSPIYHFYHFTISSFYQH